MLRPGRINGKAFCCEAEGHTSSYTARGSGDERNWHRAYSNRRETAQCRGSQRGWPLILSALRKRTSLHRKAEITPYRLLRVAQKCCFTEIIGDTFAQC